MNFNKPKLTRTYSCKMSDDMFNWLEATSIETGDSMSRIIRDAIAEKRKRSEDRRRRPVKVL